MPIVVAVLDACVLFKGQVTDFLLTLAEFGLFEPIWSDEIHAEWTRNLHTGMNIPVSKIEYRKNEMDRAFPLAKYPADPDVLAAIMAKCSTKSQRKDAHVIGTAVAAEATLIVTDNSPDFPMHILDGYGMRKLSPDSFCIELFGLFPEDIIAGARHHRASLRRTSPDVNAYLANLARNGDLSGISALLAPFGYRL